MSSTGRPGPMTMKRLHREMADLAKEELGGMTLVPDEKNLFEWKGTLPGPEGSVYEGGVFHVAISLAHDYPFSAPRATFNTRIYHMNISERGQVCVDLLKHNWSPALSLFKVMLSLSSLLTDPNPKDPLVPQIATEYQRRRAQHDRTARQWTEMYAKPQTPPPQATQQPPKPPAPPRRNRPAQQAAPAPASTPIHSEVIPIDISPPRRSARTQNRSDRPIAIDISDDESQPAARKRTRTTAANDTNGTSNRKRRNVGQGVNGAGSSTVQGRDVIVIDD